MKTLVVYFSKFGNTQKVAESIAHTLLQAGDARAISIDELTASGLKEVDLFVIGSPTYYLNVPDAVREFFQKIPYRGLVGKSVAVFDLSIKMWKPLMLLTASRRLVFRLRLLGGKTIVPAETFFVENNAPQDAALGQFSVRDSEIERAKTWANLMLRRLGAQSV